jgi:hypothetical protein
MDARHNHRTPQHGRDAIIRPRLTLSNSSACLPQPRAASQRRSRMPEKIASIFLAHDKPLAVLRPCYVATIS